jgi:curved DNA-binding protein
VSTRARDFYEVLGVGRDASQEDIRKAYRRLARAHHPDVSRQADAEERFKDISEAYEALGDPEKRAAYDRFGQAWRQAGQAGPGPEPDGRRRAATGPEGVRVEFGDAEDLEDLFGGIFGRRGMSMRGAGVEAALDLNLEEAARGGSRWIAVDGRQIEVRIPQGAADGQLIRIPGQGGEGIGGGPPGDLFLRVRLRPHPRFRVEGRDLHVDLALSPADAALGTTAEVRTLDGTARVKVPPGSSSGRKLRLRGRGLPDPAGRAGDLYAHVKIVVPKRLSDEERRLYEELRRVASGSQRSAA